MQGSNLAYAFTETAPPAQRTLVSYTQKLNFHELAEAMRDPKLASRVAYEVPVTFDSDNHLGEPTTRPGSLYLFDRVVRAPKRYHVGDIIDGQRMEKEHYWPQSHENILQQRAYQGQHGQEHIYIPGNHDWRLRPWMEQQGLQKDDPLGALKAWGLTFMQRALHETGGETPKRYLINHGDEACRWTCDNSAERWVNIGDIIYTGARQLEEVIKRGAGRSINDPPVFPIASPLKTAFKRWDGFFSGYNYKLAQLVWETERTLKDAGLLPPAERIHGNIGGHTHDEKTYRSFGLDYVNVGNQVDKNTMGYEDWAGNIRLINMGKLGWAFTKLQRQQQAGDTSIVPHTAFTVLATRYGMRPVLQSEEVMYQPEFDAVASRQARPVVPSHFGDLLEICSGQSRAPASRPVRMGKPAVA